MTPQQYLEKRLSALREATPGDRSQTSGTAERIHARLLSKKFRKIKASADCEAAVARVIKHCMDANVPIVLSTLFGGNKLWRFDEAPEVVWAELFNLFYYSDWAKTVAAEHAPGVILDYISQDISVASLNNVPRSETDQYSITYRNLIAWLEPYLPTGVSVRYRRHFDAFENPDDYYAELEQGKQEILKENGGQLPKLNEAMKIATELNVRTKSGQDKDPLWREKVELEHQAIFRTKTLNTFFTAPDRISLSPTNYEDSNSIITGSTKRSYAKFWAGVGALERLGDSFGELVLTPSQLENTPMAWGPVAFEGLTGKNFSRVRLKL